MDAIDNRITSSSSVGTPNEENLVNSSAAAKQNLDSQIAEKEIEELQQEQQQERVPDARPTVPAADPGTEWDPWKFMVIRHQ